MPIGDTPFLSPMDFIEYDPCPVAATLRRVHGHKHMGKSTVNRLLVAKGLRAFADGYVSLLLPLYLIGLGFTSLQVGTIATATLLGSGALTLGVSHFAARYPYRTLLLGAAALMAATGVAFALETRFWPLVAIAFVGTLNPSSGDVSIFLPLEHAALSRAVSDDVRTATFAKYSVVASTSSALGALAAALPTLLMNMTGLSATAAIQWMFGLYALLASLAGMVYRDLPASAERNINAQQARAPLTESKKAVYTLAALFSLDAFGGGLIVQSMLALWLYQQFDLSAVAAGKIFFWTGLLTAISYLVSARIAKRIGLVNTMVFTHLPSSLCLLAMPFVSHVNYVIALLFIRSALSQMDVPARSSYVMAIVPPEERPAAASVTSVPRSLASAASPILAGYLLGLTSFGWPLLAAGALKMTYDLLLLARFRSIRPPEE